jgi:hypothetical protein
VADFFMGNTGSVTFTSLGTGAATVIAFNATMSAPLVDVGVFNATNFHDYESGRQDCRGTITVRQKHTDTTQPVHTAAVLTLKSRAAAPYVALIGSAIIETIPFIRTRGDEPDNIDIAFAMTGSDWTFSDVPA